MAVNYSKKLVEEAFHNSYFVPNIENKFLKKIIKIFNIFIIKKYRFFIYNLKNFIVNLFTNIRIILKNKKKNYFKLSITKTNYDKISNELEKNGWVYIENFLDTNFYNLLLKNWPSNLYFKYKNDPLKNYLWGFEYLKKGEKEYYLNNDEKKLILFDELHAYYNFIKSKFFKQFISELNSDRCNFECVTINATSAKKNSFLIPHLDSISEDNNRKLTINCIHFIDGNDDDIEYSGGTGIFQDNEFKDKIFTPKTLKNSILIYNSKLKFFHGFQKMKKNNYRKAIAFQFFQND